MIENIIKFLIFVNLLYAEYVTAALLDPTRPPNFLQRSTMGVQSTIMELNEVIISKDQKIAIINGQTLKIGDKILGNQITKIDLDDVELQGPRGHVVLYVNGKPIKQAK